MNYVYSIQDPQLKTYFPNLAKNLFALNSANFELLNGFIISKNLVAKLIKDLKLEDLWIEYLSRLNIAKMQTSDLEKFSIESQKRITNYQFDEEFKEEVSKAYSNISGFLDSGISVYQLSQNQDILVKDLNIKGVDEILLAIKNIIDTEFKAETILAKFRDSKSLFEIDDNFLILKSLQPEVSGYAYNFELINNLKDKYTIEAIFGLNTLLEKKSVIPDQYIWDLDENRISEKFLSKQPEMEILVSSKEKTKVIPISKSWQDRQKLDDNNVSKLVEKLKILDNEFGGRLFKVKWAFESGKLFGLGIEEFNSKLSEHFVIQEKQVNNETPQKNELNNFDEIAKVIEKSEKLQVEETKPVLGLNIFDKLFKPNLATKKTEQQNNKQSIFDGDNSTTDIVNVSVIQKDNIENIEDTIESKISYKVGTNISEVEPKEKYSGKSAFEILYPERISQKAKPKNELNSEVKHQISVSNSVLNTQIQTNMMNSNNQKIVNNLVSKIPTSRISDINAKSENKVTNKLQNKEVEKNDAIKNVVSFEDNRVGINFKNEDLKVEHTIINTSTESRDKLKPQEVEKDSISENKIDSTEKKTITDININKQTTLIDNHQKKISSNIKTATKVYLNLHGESNLNTSDILSSDGAIVGFDYKNLDIEGLSIVLSNNSQLYNPKPVIYELGGLSKYTRYDQEIPLEVEKQFSSILTARNLEGNKNLHAMINTIKTTDEYLNIKKFMSSIGLRRSSNFKVYLSLDNLAAFHNLQKILEDGVDGIFINLEELSKFAVGNTNSSDAFQIYDIETIGILNLLKDAVNFCSKVKVPVLVNISTLAGEKLEYNLKKILQLGIFGVQTSRTNLVNVKEILSKLELENLFK